MAILIKLFATNIIANKRFGRSNKERINAMFFLFAASASFSCTPLSEKKATSAPEIKAEEKINPRSTTIFIQITGDAIVVKVKINMGSGSKKIN